MLKQREIYSIDDDVRYRLAPMQRYRNVYYRNLNRQLWHYVTPCDELLEDESRFFILDRLRWLDV